MTELAPVIDLAKERKRRRKVIDLFVFKRKKETKGEAVIIPFPRYRKRP